MIIFNNARLCSNVFRPFMSGVALISAMSMSPMIWANDEAAIRLNAPDSALLLEQKIVGSFDGRVIVDGWSCGGGTHKIATRTGELVRQQALTQTKLESLEALIEKLGADGSLNESQRRDILEETSAKIDAAYEPVIEPLSLDKVKGISTAETTAVPSEVISYSAKEVPFIESGITDGGTTAVFSLPDCIVTSSLEEFKARMKVAARNIVENRTAYDALAESFLSGVGR